MLYKLNTFYPVQLITAGAGYDLIHVGNLRIAPGAQISLYHADAALDGLYGKNPIAAEIYLHIYPGVMK